MAFVILIIFWALLPFALIPLTVILFVDRASLKKQIRALRSQLPAGAARPSAAPPVPPMPKPPVPPARTVRPQNVYTAPMPASVAPPTPVPTAEPVKKNIRPATVVFAIGASFIALAGMIFATTAWWRLSPILRAGIVLLLTVLFFAASQIAESHFSLRQTGRAFYALGCLFIPVTFLTVGYFRLFGTFLSIYGGGRQLLWVLAFGMAGGACAIGTARYRSTLFHWAAYACGSLSTLYLLLFLTDGEDVFTLLLALVAALLYLLHESSRLPETDRRILGILSLLSGGGAWMAGAWTLVNRTAWSLWLVLACAVLTGLASIQSLRGKRWMRYVQPILAYTLCSGIARFVILSPNWTGILLAVLVMAAFFLCREARLRTAWSDALTLLWLCACVLWNPHWPWFLPPDLLLCAFVAFLALERAPSQRRIAATWALPYLPLVFLPHLLRNLPQLRLNEALLAYAFLVCAAAIPFTLTRRESLRRFELPLFSAASGCLLVFIILFQFIDPSAIALLLGLSCILWCARLAALLACGKEGNRRTAFLTGACSLITCVFFGTGELFNVSGTVLLLAPAAVSLALFLLGELLRRENPKAFLTGQFSSFSLWSMFVLTVLIAASCFLNPDVTLTGLLADLTLCAFVVILALERTPCLRRVAATWALPCLPLAFTPYLLHNLPQLGMRELLLAYALLACAAAIPFMLTRREALRRFTLPLFVEASGGTLLLALLFLFTGTSGFSLPLALFCAVWCVRLTALLTGSAQGGRSLAFYFSAGSLIAFAFAAAYELFPRAPFTRLLYAPAAVSLILFCVGELLRRENPGAFLTAKLRAFAPWAMLALCALIGFGGWFTGFLLLAGCLTLFFLRQSLPGSGRIPLTVAAACLCGAWWTQPFWSVPEAVRVEWMLLPLIAAPLALRLLLWRDRPKQMEAIQFGFAAFCSLILGFAALLRASTAIILGVCAAGLVIASLLDRLRKRWFLLGGITLLCLAVYATRVFWLNLAWWVYLLVAGVALIATACINERSGLIGRFAEKIRQWDW